MNKLLPRLLIFFIGIPLVIGIVCLKTCNHLALHIVIVAAALLSTDELYAIFSKNMTLQPERFVLAASVLPPFAGLGCAVFNLPYEYINIALLASFLLILSFEVFTVRTFEESIQHVASTFFIVMYSGYLITFISRLTFHTHSIQFISTFLFMVFMCDSFAWLFGMLFGKNNRGLVAASPNKSIAGFVGGYTGSILAGIAGKFIWPEVFTGPILKVIFLGIIIASSGIIGDLAESVLKRSAHCKDSGTLIPGRGGILDSIDSILFSSPVYFIAIKLMFARI